MTLHTRRNFLMNGLLLAAPSLARATGGRGEPIKIGVLHSSTGTTSVSEKPIIDATQFAIDEINQSGGLLNREVLPIIEDGASDPVVFTQKAEKLLSKDAVSFVFGCYTTASRKAVLPAFERHHGLLYYPTFYEGMEISPNILYIGSEATQSSIPLIQWLVKNRGKKFLIVGSDYLFPRATGKIIRSTLKKMGGVFLNEIYTPLGSTSFSSVVRDIKLLKPDVVISIIVGNANKAFYKQLNDAGINGRNTTIVALAVTEAEAIDIGSDHLQGVYTCMSYFQSLVRFRNTQFVKAFKNKFGANRVLCDTMESAYSAVHLWRKAVEKSNSLAVDQVIQASAGMDFSAPSGYIRIHATNHHTWKYTRIGRFDSAGQVEILYESELTEPHPFGLANT